MIVMKFGGTSVGSRDALLSVASIVMAELHRNPLIVVSAASGVTDLLLAAAREASVDTATAARNPGTPPVPGAWNALQARYAGLLDELGLRADFVDQELQAVQHLLESIATVGELSPRCQDLVVSYGERISARVVAAFLTANGIAATPRMAWDMGMTTDANFGCARPVDGSAERMRQAWYDEREFLVVTTGFIGRDARGAVTTLGRGGSDLSASIFGAALDAEEIQIWTDVCGVLTADPRVVRSARVLSRLPFAEAAELAACGAKVLHPDTLEPAARKAIPVRVKNTFNAESPGTLIVADGGTAPLGPVAIAARHDMSMVSIHDRGHHPPAVFLARVFEVLRTHRIAIEALTTAHWCLSFVTDTPAAALNAASSDLVDVASMSIAPQRSVVSVIGQDIEHTVDVAGQIFGSLGRFAINVEMISQGASENSITFVVAETSCDLAMRILHAQLFDANDRTTVKDRNAPTPRGDASAGPDARARSGRTIPAAAKLATRRPWSPRRPRRLRNAGTLPR